uniref:Uncharacterized protein n=1 Tax=Helicotheca tamesis TaxID=374047 RepID=A0A7S2HLE7_9STRA|mmetsp:Transcript_1906/g.2731  ORF Transcript_1906/g.2731 Transcript_1906/m.2731 type:complete len:429 (+) Transcript_1906:90-1376(+)|eukprot:CAMPEP_0185735442 /NCGR_PEP_ID=MMETSP1171-20130828/25311_1 /TAXON_ID=374046 /ORGANISM="Helicotheca tamensis, Strain CCMP826" /LENGTH=428 /DNA_ID=CAMNT_0028405757 /DNA_START=14 /DNA_END=1300 /DNA_ORIENTATION=-
MSFGWGGYAGGRGGLPQRFEEQYHCYSVAYADRGHLEKGDKILLPPSAFDTLARLQVDYPMLFQLQSPTKGTMTHCGVLEFTAEEGSCYVPFWMMQNLLIEEGSVLTVTNVSLPKASFVKLQPQHVDFLEITNPRAVLEHALRNFSCITKGDVICVPYNEKKYQFEIKEVKPQDAACIIETDCNVDFDAPLGYKEPNVNGVAADDGTGSMGGNSSAASSLANLPKQSAYAPAEQRSSDCPSPTPSSASGLSGAGSQQTGAAAADSDTKPRGTHIEDGRIVREEDDGAAVGGTAVPTPDMVAQRTGATGVQTNSAIAVNAPGVDYWAVQAGEGSRLDGKKPTVLKDKEGNAVDIRKLRAEAAARRAEAAARAAATQPSYGTTVDGTKVVEEEKKVPSAPARKNRSRIGGKYSRLKQSGVAFSGKANEMK